MGFWLAKFVLLGPLLRLIWRPWIAGRENIPDDRPAILASNHLSFCDSFFLPLLAPRKVTFLAKAEYFTTPGVKGLISRMFFSGVGQVPIDRSDSDASRAALATGARVLGAGNNLLGIYPEGTRSPDGRLYRGKTGVARLALETGAVVIPCAMVNTEIIQPTGRLIPKFRPRPGVQIGKPLDFARYEGMAGDRFVERSVTDEIMYALMELSGQEYVDAYAADVKKASGADAVAFGSRPEAVRELGDRHPDSRAS
ncbi:1-acyl-sn-glycerol-3-phosphate acyltransferase [Jatrophihabitans endophyticus]|uniref:lysophospholipid acyltransferase family protein n=1 Tax=Jatrophihabitans endophyticus TaxID=1206085 RepID=UPI0019E43C7D|nr:lysophospholipid acyltransferase family protein [Jatrophihabitans endophyticus]MBE7187593.1 1-acyl-sn-glycerol-3-phosphate acyltransferase [Jatrophihabitans endophyticus]